jgi:hypothetical protein
MPDEFGVHRMRVVKRFLERQQAQDQIDGVADRTHPPLSPGPYLRTHVLNGRNATGLEAWRDPQIEFLRVDADVHRGSFGKHALDQVATDAQQSWQVRNDFEQPHDGEALCSFPRLTAGSNHSWAGDTGEACLWQSLPQCCDQLRAEVVPRRFSRHQNNEHRRWTT